MMLKVMQTNVEWFDKMLGGGGPAAKPDSSRQ
jgi:hypothetical protein